MSRCLSAAQAADGLCWKELLRIKSPHKLLYALEIIEALGKPNRRIHRESTVSTGSCCRALGSGPQAPTRVHLCPQGSYSDLYPDSDDSAEDQIENSKNSWSCKVPPSPPSGPRAEAPLLSTGVRLQFVASGGLQLLLEIFNSAILEPRDQESWTVVSLPAPAGAAAPQLTRFFRSGCWTAWPAC